MPQGTNDKMNRRKAREQVFHLLFEARFHADRTPAEIYETAQAQRAFEEDEYIRRVFFGTLEKQEELATLIEKHSHGWKRSRISPVSLSVLMLASYEILYADDVPATVAVNEALELVKAYDEEGARAFINGVLNAVMQGAQGSGDEK